MPPKGNNMSHEESQEIKPVVQKLIFGYDTETCGIPNWKIPSDDPSQPHLVQLAAQLVNAETREVVDSMDVIIKPDGWEIPQETIDIHGITMEMAEKEGIPEQEALEMFLAMRGDHERVAYNKTFDQRIVRIACKRYLSEEAMEKWAVKEDHHCSMMMAKKSMGVKSVKLVDAYKHFKGVEMEGNHNAMADTKACLDVYFGVIDSQEV